VSKYFPGLPIAAAPELFKPRLPLITVGVGVGFDILDQREYPVGTTPLCQTSCRLNRIETFGGADIGKWHDTDRDTKIG
jgi:hypothetical protein